MLIYMFPGQGSQSKGMGDYLFNQYPRECHSVSGILGYDIVELCLEDKLERLNNTLYTQPAIYFVSALHYLSLNKKPNYVIGHSLGLFAALYAAEVISLEQGINIVANRAKFMAEVNNGSMLAVIGKNVMRLENKLAQLDFHDIDIANYNSDNQIVLSGKRDRLIQLQAHLNDLSYRTILLPVSGAFHSRYMKSVLAPFFDYLSNQTFSDFKVNVISSTNGEILLKTHLIEEMAYQLIQPVRWHQVISNVKNTWQNVELKEVGPGSVLTTLYKRMNQIEVN